MAKLGLQAEIVTKGKKVRMSLELYKFKEEDAVILYCPALDLSSYGRTEREAKSGFEDIVFEYVSYCTAKHTLVKDLQNHGWHVKSSSQKKVKAPSVKEMLETNEMLQDIIYNKNYEKLSRSILLPQFA